VGENICQLYIRQRTELNRTSSKEEIQMAKKYMKKCSPSVAIKLKPH
jgi:hypothetical protein